MTREIIPITSEEQWLAERAKDITSTAIPALFELSPYCTVFELYHAHKNGIVLPFQENDRTKAGKAIEQYAAEVAAEKLSETHGPVAAVRRLDFYARIPGERMGSSFDFEVEFEDGHKLLLELKAVDYFRHKEKWVEGEAPEHVEIQLQHQLECIDRYDHGVIAAFTSIYDCTLYERERDREMGQALRAASRKFWADVDAGNEPAPNFYRDGDVIAALYRHAGGEAIDLTADEGMEELLERFRRNKDEESAFGKEASAAKAEIHRRLGEAAGGYTERFKVTAGWTKDVQGTLVTEEMVGTYIGGRKGYRQCLVYDMNKKKAKAAA